MTGSPAVSRSWIDAAPAALAAAARRRGGGAARARGFSMLEVLVAFVILALVGTALFRLFSGALANAAAADDYSRAVLVAESVLDEAAGAQPLREGEQSGSADDGRIEWTTRVTPYAPPEVNSETESGSELLAVRLWRIAAEVRFTGPNGKARALTLATLRIGGRELP